MKNRVFAAALAFIAGLALYAAAASAQMGGPGMTGGYGPGQGGYCPRYGQYEDPRGSYDTGRGMMGGGYGMGSGMMGRGYGRGRGMMGQGYVMGPGIMDQGDGYYGPRSGYGPQSQLPEEPLTREEATQQVEEYLMSTRNPNLEVGEIQEKGNNFEADIVTKDGSLVDKLLVNKDTGRIRSAY